MPPERYYSLKALANLLDLSPTTIRRLVEAGHLPQPKQVLGRIPRWTESQVTAYQLALEHGLLPPVPEPVKGKIGSPDVPKATQKRQIKGGDGEDEKRG